MNYEDFFDNYEDCKFEENQFPFESFTIEEIYTMFRDRMIAELSVDVPGTSHYGVLVETENKDKSLLQGN